MALAHAIYGLGALVSPLVATQFARTTFKLWNLHYVCSVAIMILNSALLAYVFRLKRDTELFAVHNYTPMPQARPKDAIAQLEPSSEVSDHAIRAITLSDLIINDQDRTTLPRLENNNDDSALSTSAKMKLIASSKFVHLASVLACIYVGLEFTIGSWAVTYVVEALGGGDDSGYISSGFFGGLTVGRVLHIPISWVISEQNGVMIYILLALGLQVVRPSRSSAASPSC